MASKRNPAERRDPNQVTAVAPPNQEEAAPIEWTVLRPTVQAALTIQEYGKIYGNLDLSELIDALTAQTKAVNNGDLGRGEAMLTAQAHILDAIFNNLTRQAIKLQYMAYFDRYLKPALRAQSQCRATLETLANMKNPPIAGYVKQANVAHGPQQVNNAPTRKNPNLESKLLEENNGERLDIGAPRPTGHTNPAMASLGKGDWAKDAGG